jgi:prevent-host-death family protein
MIVNIHAAKTNLSKLIEKAEAGEEVVIARNGKPAVKLTPVSEAAAQAGVEEGAMPAWVGSMKGEIWISPDIDAVEAEIAREFEESEIFPPDDHKR